MCRKVDTVVYESVAELSLQPEYEVVFFSLNINNGKYLIIVIIKTTSSNRHIFKYQTNIFSLYFWKLMNTNCDKIVHCSYEIKYNIQIHWDPQIDTISHQISFDKYKINFVEYVQWIVSR